MIAICKRCHQMREAFHKDAYSPTYLCRECHLSVKGIQTVAGGTASLALHESAVLRFVLGARQEVHEPVVDLHKAIDQLTSSLAQVPPDERALRAELGAMLTILNGAMSRHVRTEIASCETKAV